MTQDTSVLRRSFQNLLIMTEASPEDVAEARLVLELGIIDMVRHRATEEDLATLEAHCELEAEALEAGTYSPEHAQSFHVKLGELTHNPALAIVAGTFRGALSMSVFRSREEADTERFRHNVRDHRAIGEALRSGDQQAVRASVASHLTRGFPGHRREPLLAALSIELVNLL